MNIEDAVTCATRFFLDATALLIVVVKSRLTGFRSPCTDGLTAQ